MVTHARPGRLIKHAAVKPFLSKSYFREAPIYLFIFFMESYKGLMGQILQIGKSYMMEKLLFYS